MKTILKIIFIICVLNILDALLTEYLVMTYGIDCELNPVMVYIMELVGIPLWAISKIVVGTGCLIYVVKRLSKMTLTKSFKVVVYFTFLLYSFVVINNSLQIVLN